MKTATIVIILLGIFLCGVAAGQFIERGLQVEELEDQSYPGQK